MATNWNAVLANINNSNDILAILKKILPLLEGKVDVTTIDEVIAELNKMAADGKITIDEALATITILESKIEERTNAFNEAIDAASAAAAGANGWVAQLVLDSSGKNQQEINNQLLNTKTIDLSYLKPSNGFDISDLVNAILVKTSDTPIELILPKADYFVIEKQIITPEDSKGITIDLNGAIIKAGPNNPDIDYLFVLYSTTNNPIVVKNGKIDGSLRAQNLFESTNVQDLKLGASGIACQGINVLFENLDIIHLYGQTTKCFCRNLIVRNVNIDDCGGHWYANNDYDMFGDAFYIGTGWNTSGVINVSFENVKANGKHSDQYVENHQPGSPLSQVQYSRIGITIEKFGGTNNNTVYISMNNCNFKNYERGFHQEIQGITSYITLNNTNLDSCVLFGAYLTDAMYASAKNCVFGFYDSAYNGSKGVTRGYGGSSFAELDSCQVINKGTSANFQMLGTGGNLKAKNTIFYRMSKLWCSSTSVDLIGCSIDIIEHSDLNYVAWASNINMKDVDISYSGSDPNLKIYFEQMGSFKKLINVSFDRIYLLLDSIGLAGNFKDVSLTVPNDDTRDFVGTRFKVVTQNNDIKQMPSFLWGVSEQCLLSKRFHRKTYSKPTDSSVLNLIDDDLKKLAKNVSLFGLVIKGHEDNLSSRLNNISYSAYGSGYYLCIAKYDPTQPSTIKLLSSIVSVGSTSGAGYDLTIDTNLNVTGYGSYASYVHLAMIPYSEIDTLPYIPDSIYNL
ncbi:hypothetical protein [Acinetobacter oleivorans]|uniref:hypothetical protein n=1 Tax=Acinetobacter oleivorans TaxID=1148157 RepID=UPI0012509FF7|nr:hypothetical protein [Acinetobacter oleivorans]